MPKDRYKTRASWDTTFKYGEYSPPLHFTKRTITFKQIELIKKMIKCNNINLWEKNFLIGVSKKANLSPKEKNKLNLIYLKNIKK